MKSLPCRNFWEAFRKAMKDPSVHWPKQPDYLRMQFKNFRSGNTKDIKLTSFLEIARAHRYEVELVKGDMHIPVAPKMRKPEVAY